MAKIVLCGEAWGEAEEKAFQATGVISPFVGQAGSVLDAILEEVGLARAELTILNVMNERPPNNNFDVYYEKKQPTQKLRDAYARLTQEILDAKPNVIVCLGNEAMRAVLGHEGVMDWRGSVVSPPTHSPLQGVKCIPTIHPAAVLREWTFRPAVVADFKRIKKESEYAQICYTPREAKINPSLEEVLSGIEAASRSDYCAFDIETESGQVTCIGLSYRADRAICIPFWFASSGSIWSPEEEQLIWSKLKELLEAESPKKIAHNGMYELEYLTATVGIRPKIHLDTMLMFHTLYPELPKSLAFLVSLYTDHPYYKYQRKAAEMDVLWEYNAKDAMLTLECAMKIEKELSDAGLTAFHEKYVHALVDPMFSMTHKGVRFDTDKCREMRRQYEADIERWQCELDTLVGHPLNIGSHKQMTTWLYTELGLPQQWKRRATGGKTLSADEEALETLYKSSKNEAIAIVLKMREAGKILSTYLNVRLDNDKRIRCTYNIAGTETGRLSSSATCFGTGSNLQNTPDGDVRSLFLADPGYVFINADLSQAEARVVAYLSGEKRLIEVFNEGGDIHRKNASNIFNVKESEVTDEQRYLAKRIVHASNYGMGYKTFAKTASVPEALARRLLAQYFAAYPRIKIWHMQTRDRLNKSRTLVTPFGRPRVFFNKWSESLLKEGLAFIPQSTVADCVNQAIIELDQKWKTEDKTLLLQVHDSILAQVREDKLDEAVAEIKEAMLKPITIGYETFTIPVDVKVGLNWGTLSKYKQQKECAA